MGRSEEWGGGGRGEEGGKRGERGGKEGEGWAKNALAGQHSDIKCCVQGVLSAKCAVHGGSDGFAMK